jgi:DNA-binding response OmpR family regulator
MKLKALHLEDDDVDALFVQRTLEQSGFEVSITHASTAEQFTRELARAPLDLIMVDNGLPGFDGSRAITLARTIRPEVPFIFVSGAADERQVSERLAAGAADYVLKGQLWQLPIAIRRARASIPAKDAAASSGTMRR